MVECPFHKAGICDADHPVEKFKSFDNLNCVALIYLYTQRHHLRPPENSEKVGHVPDSFTCSKDGSKV